MFRSQTLLLLLVNFITAGAITQTAQVDVQLSNGVSYTFYASQASFGSYPKMGVENNQEHSLSLAPRNNALLCNNVTRADPAIENTFLMVPRGECTFETKAMNAQRLGAAGLIVRGSLLSRYSINETSKEVIYPSPFNDFDCNKGRAEVPASAISMTPTGYNAELNDPVLSGTSASNLCLSKSPDKLELCPSKACLLTGNQTSTSTDTLEACCAWDLHVWLYNDPTFGPDDVTIPAVYITLQQGERLLTDLQNNQIRLIVSSRVRASYNMSAMLIWALGVFVCSMAAYASASDYRGMTQFMTRHREQQAASNGTASSGSSESPSEMVSLSPAGGTITGGGGGLVVSNGGGDQVVWNPPNRTYLAPGEETLELSAGHALGFIVMASSGLMILFVFKIYSLVKVMYGFGCSRAVMQVIFIPLFDRIFRKLQIPNKVAFHINMEDIGDITAVDVIAGLCAYTVGAAWLYISFTVRHPETNTFFWVTQDVLGACMCIMFLSLIKLNSMRVASILLMVAFVYDIFFVFVTPLIFKGESVMITVATSGGPPKADPSWCEKYPDDANCQGGDPLPMLLTVPRIADYQGGASLLGLGDIVLPGLLLSFAARLDAAKHFLGAAAGGGPMSTGYGYFAPLILAYAIGLFMANAAVYLMNMGQPALLYLVPMCLGTMCFLGWRRNELASLWEGPKVIRTVDAMIYGEYEPTTTVEQEVDDELGEATTEPLNNKQDAS